MILIAVLLLLITTALTLFIFVGIFFFILDLFLDLPYVATNRKKLETIMNFANLKENQTAIDLGSGDGRLLIASAKMGAIAIGYEKNPVLILISRLHAYLKGLTEQVQIKNISFWKSDLEVADAIFVYAFKKTMPKFEEYIYKNAKKGTRVVVNTNPFPNKKPVKSENGIFLYVI